MTKRKRGPISKAVRNRLLDLLAGRITDEGFKEGLHDIIIRHEETERVFLAIGEVLWSLIGHEDPGEGPLRESEERGWKPKFHRLPAEERKRIWKLVDEVDDRIKKALRKFLEAMQ